MKIYRLENADCKYLIFAYKCAIYKTWSSPYSKFQALLLYGQIQREKNLLVCFKRQEHFMQ